MDKKTNRVASIDLKRDGPTEVKIDDLYTWVVWQYPRKLGHGLRGAVKPPIADSGWLPAEITKKGKVILVHGQIKQPFKSASAAAEWLKEKDG